ncbi:MAG: MBL fold metallo-hydrolase [Clostridia bacterium]|nr:MBL fold metallo-hydrolase [Clostridia bacterium]
MKEFDAIPAFRMLGNLYFVGSYQQSSHIIDTGDGLIMIDVGGEENLPYVLAGFERLGFSLADVKYLLLSHWHWDHADGVPALRKLTDAKVLIGEPDAAWLKFPVDGVLRDGDKITLGNTTVTCLLTPGHTEGSLSFFFDVKDGEQTLRCGMFGGAGHRQLSKAFLDKYGIPYFMREEFFASIERLEKEHVDVLVGNHSWHNRTREGREILLQGGPNPFIDPAAWGIFLAALRKKMWKLIADESREQFLVLAHRGASEYCPGNTMLAFYAGVYMGAPGIETDVRRTKDGVLVLFHDATLEKAMGQPGSISDYTLEELKGFPMEKNGLRDRIPTLDEFLAAFGDMDLSFAIELKDADIETDVAEAIRRYGLEKKAVVTSFHLEYLQKMHTLAPELKLGYLARAGKITEEVLAQLKASGIDTLCPRVPDILPENTKDWHGHGFRVRAWGVTNEEDMRQVYDNGADGTTVNFPDKLLAYIQEQNAKNEEK